MLYHAEGFFKIAFGDVRSQFNPRELKFTERSKQLLAQQPFEQLKHSMKLNQLILLHQVHGNAGLTISSTKQAEQFEAFSSDGDFLITNVRSVGLAIATADCLPIVLYSAFCPVIAVVHAGWRGSVARVALTALEHMERIYFVKPSMVRVFFGPSARLCCYAVGQNVLEDLNYFSYKDDVIKTRGAETFFDLPLFNQLQLQEAGILKSAFNVAYNSCTICDDSFCSYRRQKNTQRQMTVVSLK